MLIKFVKCSVFLESKNEETASLIKSQTNVVATLTKGCQSVSAISSTSEVPAGCAVAPVSTTLNAHLLVRGLVNIDNELKKLDKKLDMIQAQINKYEAQSKKPEWEKAPENVRKQAEEAKQAQESEKETILAAKKNFESIRDT